MALTVYTSKDNAWREYVNSLRVMFLRNDFSIRES